MTSVRGEASFETVVAFHGHRCPGLAIGYRMARAALSRLAAIRSLRRRARGGRGERRVRGRRAAGPVRVHIRQGEPSPRGSREVGLYAVRSNLRKGRSCRLRTVRGNRLDQGSEHTNRYDSRRIRVGSSSRGDGTNRHARKGAHPPIRSLLRLRRIRHGDANSVCGRRPPLHPVCSCARVRLGGSDLEVEHFSQECVRIGDLVQHLMHRLSHPVSRSLVDSDEDRRLPGPARTGVRRRT